jgi:hypothetical protein
MTSLDSHYRLLAKFTNVNKLMLYITMYNNTETTIFYYVSYEGFCCQNSFSQLFMYALFYVAVQEDTALEPKHTMLTDMMDTETLECGS